MRMTEEESDTPRTDALGRMPLFLNRERSPECGEAILHARELERELKITQSELERSQNIGVNNMTELLKTRAERDKWKSRAEELALLLSGVIGWWANVNDMTIPMLREFQKALVKFNTLKDEK